MLVIKMRQLNSSTPPILTKYLFRYGVFYGLSRAFVTTNRKKLSDPEDVYKRALGNANLTFASD